MTLQEVILPQGTHCGLIFVHTKDDATVSIEPLLSQRETTILITAVGSL